MPPPKNTIEIRAVKSRFPLNREYANTSGKAINPIVWWFPMLMPKMNEAK